MIINERYEIDELADAAGGYFAMPSADELAYTELYFTRRAISMWLFKRASFICAPVILPSLHAFESSIA